MHAEKVYTKVSRPFVGSDDSCDLVSWFSVEVILPSLITNTLYEHAEVDSLLSNMQAGFR